MSGKAHILLSDECWVALATLHREAPGRISFSAREILDRVRKEKAHPELRPGALPHIYQHNVGNVPPSSGRYRMFFRLEDGTLRLFRPGDVCHPDRRGKAQPHRHQLPARFHALLDWYEQEYCAQPSPSEELDPVLLMRGVGKEIWDGIDPDAYVRELRAGWEAEPDVKRETDGDRGKTRGA